MTGETRTSQQLPQGVRRSFRRRRVTLFMRYRPLGKDLVAVCDFQPATGGNSRHQRTARSGPTKPLWPRPDHPESPEPLASRLSLRVHITPQIECIYPKPLLRFPNTETLKSPMFCNAWYPEGLSQQLKSDERSGITGRACSGALAAFQTNLQAPSFRQRHDSEGPESLLLRNQLSKNVLIILSGIISIRIDVIFEP